jgi:hypothetical protein
MAFTIPFQILGAQVSGDLGGYTIYTDMKGQKVVFPKSPPEKPPSSAQLFYRARFTAAQSNWKALSLADKESLELACRRLSLPMTGQNLYVSVQLKNDVDAYATIEMQSGIQLPAFEPVPWE